VRRELWIFDENQSTLVRLALSHQPAVLFSHTKPATSNQPTVFFSQNKPAPAITTSQPNMLQKETNTSRMEIWK
jgi:hypothetical protein